MLNKTFFFSFLFFADCLLDRSLSSLSKQWLLQGVKSNKMGGWMFKHQQEEENL